VGDGWWPRQRVGGGMVDTGGRWVAGTAAAAAAAASTRAAAPATAGKASEPEGGTASKKRTL